MLKFYVYQLRAATDDLPFYVGKGQGSRKLDHFKAHSIAKRDHKSNTILKFQRLGVEVMAETLFEFDNEEDAFAKEKEIIALYGRRDIGTGCLTNYSDGGEGPSNPSKETRMRMSLANTGRVVKEETKVALRAMFIGRKRPPEVGMKISAGKRGAVFSVEHRAKLSLAHEGMSQSEYQADAGAIISRRKAYEHVLSWMESGLTKTEYSNQVGIKRSMLNDWMDNKYVKAYADADGVVLPRRIPRNVNRPEVVEVVAEWKSSGMTPSAFCLEKGIATSTFNRWYRHPGVLAAIEGGVADGS